MPLYGYRCERCNAYLERERPMADSSSPFACSCGAGTMMRVFHAPAMHLYGGYGERFRQPETQQEADALRLKKQKDEESVKYLDEGFEWVPGKGIPAEFEPDISGKYAEYKRAQAAEPKQEFEPQLVEVDTGVGDG